jgi:hypothetical protein
MNVCILNDMLEHINLRYMMIFYLWLVLSYLVLMENLTLVHTLNVSSK